VYSTTSAFDLQASITCKLSNNDYIYYKIHPVFLNRIFNQLLIFPVRLQNIIQPCKVGSPHLLFDVAKVHIWNHKTSFLWAYSLHATVITSQWPPGAKIKTTFQPAGFWGTAPRGSNGTPLSKGCADNYFGLITNREFEMFRHETNWRSPKQTRCPVPEASVERSEILWQ
jgi:hypothetical protein